MLKQIEAGLADRILAWRNLAGSVAKSDDLIKKRDFLKILGSNFILKDRTLSFKRAYPYELVARISPFKEWLPRFDENPEHIVLERELTLL